MRVSLKRMTSVVIIALFSLTAFETYSAPSTKGPKLSDYTFLFYVNGSDLESRDEGGEATNLILQILSCSIPDSIKVVMATGGTKKWHLQQDSKPVIRTDICQYWELTGKQGSEKHGNFELKINLDKSAAISDTTTLTDFITWGITNYPSKRYVLVFYDHGGGSIYGFGQDELRNDAAIYTCNLGTALKDALENKNVKKVMKAAGKTKLDIVAFTCCLMGTIEVAREMKDYADYMVASEDLSQGDPNYKAIFKELQSKSNMPPVELGKLFVNSYYEQNMKDKFIIFFTCSMLDLSKIDNIIQKLNSFVNSTKIAGIESADHVTKTQQGILRALAIARASSESYAEFSKNSFLAGHVDIYDLAENIGKWLGNEKEMKSVMNAVKDAVIINKRCENRPASNGLSMFMIDRPMQKWGHTNTISDYNNSPLSSDYMKFLNSYNTLLFTGNNAELSLGKLSLDKKSIEKNGNEFSVVISHTPESKILKDDLFNPWDDTNLIETTWFVSGTPVYSENKLSAFVVKDIDQYVAVNDTSGLVRCIHPGTSYTVNDVPVPIYWDRNRDRIKEYFLSETRNMKAAELEKEYKAKAASLLEQYNNEEISEKDYKSKLKNLKKKYNDDITYIRKQVTGLGTSGNIGAATPVGSIAVRYKGQNSFLIVAGKNKEKVEVTGIWAEKTIDSKATQTAKGSYTDPKQLIDRMSPDRIKMAPIGKKVTLLYRKYRIEDGMYTYVEGPEITVPKEITLTTLPQGNYVGAFFIEDVIGRDIWSDCINYTVDDKFIANAVKNQWEQNIQSKEAAAE